MSQFKSDFLRVLSERGFIHQQSDAEGLDAVCQSEICPGYIGFDCTAPSLHAGSLVQIMLLYWLQQSGHKPIALMGGGTTQVGDPSGKDESRRMLTTEQIDANKTSLRTVFEQFLEFGDGPTDAIMPDNADWLMELNYVGFLRDVGQHLSVNQMIQRDSVKLRLEREQHLSFLEFNYMVLQAYDFVELHRRYGCRLQMGGSDQWGNIVSGIDLGRRLEGAELFAVTTPLLATSSGAKMGKTADGAIWLNSDLLSPFHYWQYWRNCEDADVGRFLKLFTTLPLDEIERLNGLEGSEINDAKKVLATEATALLHGRQAADEAAETSRKTFEEGSRGDALPSIAVQREELEQGIGLLTAFVRAGLAASNGEVRRQVKGGAIRINDEVIDDERLTLSLDHIGSDDVIKLSVGRKRHALLKVS